MSVPKSRRNESRTEYVFQSSMLATKVGQMCSRLPKRWSFTRTQYVIAAANRVMEECVMANAIYATSKTEADKRMCHLQDVLGSVYVVEQYVNQLALDQPMRPCDAGKKEQRPCITDGLFSEVAMQCELCIKLIKGVIKSDRRRWSRVRPIKRTSSRRSA